MDRIPFFPELEQFGRDVAGVIVRGMAGHPERFAFDERRSMAGASAFDRPGRGVPNSQDIVPVNDLSRHSVSVGAVRDVFDRHLALQWRGVGVLVVIADKNNRDPENGSHVDAFMPVPAARGAVAEITKSHTILASHFEGESDSRRYRYIVSKH